MVSKLLTLRDNSPVAPSESMGKVENISPANEAHTNLFSLMIVLLVAGLTISVKGTEKLKTLVENSSPYNERVTVLLMFIGPKLYTISQNLTRQKEKTTCSFVIAKYAPEGAPPNSSAGPLNGLNLHCNS